jgi:hypothetical protein
MVAKSGKIPAPLSLNIVAYVFHMPTVPKK